MEEPGMVHQRLVSIVVHAVAVHRPVYIVVVLNAVAVVIMPAVTLT